MLDKHTLKANALAAMNACIASDWAKVIMAAEYHKQEKGSQIQKLYQISMNLLDIQVDNEIEKCFNLLKEYYKNGTT